MQVETNYKGYSLTIDSRCMNAAAIHAYLSSYWVANIPLDIVQRFLANFICMRLFKNDSSIYCYQKA